VDALQVSLQGIIAVQAVVEFQPSYDKGLTIALYLGMLVGAIFWGLFADIIGRKIAFNISLFICAIFTIVAGASPTWESLGLFISLGAFGAGGNLILDTTVFIEYLPSNKQWLVSLLPSWFGVGCTIAGLVAWGFMRKLFFTNAFDFYTLLTACLTYSKLLLRRCQRLHPGQQQRLEVPHVYHGRLHLPPQYSPGDRY
jgi:MFS family permease